MASEGTFRPVVHLKCDVQQYAWGKVGSGSQVAQLRLNAQQEHGKVSSSGFEVDESKPYAELWMGSHPKAPATVVGSHLKQDLPFIQYLDENLQACLGDAIIQEYDGKLPFLFKVLSINKALSIQAHPTKDHAKILHQRAPDKYPDANHKPEMAIALTPFEAMCGFREAKDITEFFQHIPELQAVVGKDVSDAFVADPSTENLKKCFTALVHCDDEVVRSQLSLLVQRLQVAQNSDGSFSKDDESKYYASLLLRTHQQFPGDVGCFSLYFLNVINLQPGEAIFLGPNIPHAYMSGDCVECMACSDNVVRAGLTPKFKDKATLCDMLDYTMSSPSARIFRWQAEDGAPEYRVYDPPVPEFTVIHGAFSSGSHAIRPRNGPSILLVTEGRGTFRVQPDVALPVCRGSVVFVGSDVAQTLTVDEDMQFYQAVCYPTLSPSSSSSKQ